MKNLLFILLTLSFFITSCSEETDILGPNSVESLLPKVDGLTPDDFVPIKFKEKYTKNYTVDGDTGAILFARNSWRDEDGRKISLTAKLTVPQGAYKGELNFDMIFDLKNYALELYPSPYKFDNPVYLDLNFSNIDLPEDLIIDFKYLDGSEQMIYKSIKFDPEKRTLEVKGAELHHFSRYGWTRTVR